MKYFQFHVSSIYHTIPKYPKNAWYQIIQDDSFKRYRIIALYAKLNDLNKEL